MGTQIEKKIVNIERNTSGQQLIAQRMNSNLQTYNSNKARSSTLITKNENPSGLKGKLSPLQRKEYYVNVLFAKTTNKKFNF